MASSLPRASIILRRLNPGGMTQVAQMRPFFSGVLGRIIPSFAASKSTVGNQTLKQKKNKSPNKNQTRKISNTNMQTILKELLTTKTIKPIKEKLVAQPATVIYPLSKAKTHTAYVTSFQIPLIALRAIHKGYHTPGSKTRNKYFNILSDIQTEENADKLLKITNRLRQIFGGDYTTYSGIFRRIDAKTQATFNSYKPKGNKSIITHLDHIVPLQDISMKVIMMNFKNIKLDLQKIQEIKDENSFIEYFKSKLDDIMPSLDDLDTVITIYNSNMNLRLLDEDSHDIYSYIVAHGTNKETNKPQTMLEQIDMGREGNKWQKKREPGEIPRQIEGYTKGSVDQNNGKKYDKIQILKYIVEKNNLICDTLIDDSKNSAWVKHFAENMKSYMHRRAGYSHTLSRGGANLQFDEYDIYELIVALLENSSKNTNRNSPKIATTKDIRDSLEKITLHLLQYLVDIYRAAGDILENMGKEKVRKHE